MDSNSNVPETPEVRLHFLDYWRIIRLRKMVILSVFFLVVLTTAVVSYFLPKSYSATVGISVEKDVTDVSSPLAPSANVAGYDPFWIQTQVKKIESASILHGVIRKYDLAKRWAEQYNDGEPLTLEETFILLKNKMRVRPDRNTSIIEITFRSRDPKEAAEIANAIAHAYRESRLEQRRASKFNGIKILQQQLEEKEEEVRKAKAIVDQLRHELNINELADGTIYGGYSPTLNKETMRRLEQQRLDLLYEYNKYNDQFQELSKLSREELRNALPTALFPPDQNLISLFENWTLANQRLRAAVEDLGREHPEVRKLQSLVDEVDSQLNDKVDGILRGLANRVAATKASLDELEKRVEEFKAKDTEFAAKSRPYFDAKHDLEELLLVRKALRLRIDDETFEANLPVSTAVEVFDPATPPHPGRPDFPNLPLNIALGVIFGLILGVGLAFFIEYLDTSIKTIDDVERALQAPVLGVIPQNVGTLLYEGPESPAAEAYRVLRTNILFSRKDPSWNTLTVVSAGVGEGKSTTLMNLATVFAQNGDRVLIVDSDLRRPSLHKLVKVSNSVGLTNYLLRQNTLEEVIQTTPLATLDFLPSGKLPSSSMGILSSDQMKDLIKELKQRYDYVFFDSPPIMGVSDASILASEVDMAIQVIQYRRYPQPMTIRAKQMIQKVGGNLMGIVLNNINVSQDESYYYYYSGYEEYSKQTNVEGVKDKGDLAQADLKSKY